MKSCLVRRGSDSGYGYGSDSGDDDVGGPAVIAVNVATTDGPRTAADHTASAAGRQRHGSGAAAALRLLRGMC
jgi:hypothetical protein